MKRQPRQSRFWQVDYNKLEALSIVAAFNKDPSLHDDRLLLEQLQLTDRVTVDDMNVAWSLIKQRPRWEIIGFRARKIARKKTRRTRETKILKPGQFLAFIRFGGKWAASTA